MTAKRDNEEAPVSEEMIASRAYELFCARDCEHGHDLDDWFQAESEFLAKSGGPSAPRRTRAKPATKKANTSRKGSAGSS